MILTSPGDILFDFGSIKIYFYGVVMAISVLFGLLSCRFVCQKFYTKSDWEIVFNLSLGTILCGFLGARLYYVFASYQYFWQNPNEIFAFYNGGMSIHGAILGGLIYAIFYLKFKNLPVLKYLDIMSFGLVIGQIIGRWGNFFNSEAFGLPTYSFLKLYIPVEKRPLEFMSFDYFHPTFLYESLLNIVVLAIMFVILKKQPKQGIISFWYVLLYSVVRLFVEQIRLDSVLNFGNIPLAQVVSVVGILIGLIGLFYLYRPIHPKS